MKKAFTLVELLVVVAIIALLVSILLPSLNKAKNLARLIKCQTNLHAVGRAMCMYAADNDGWIPRERSSNLPINLLFMTQLSPYLNGPKIDPARDNDDAYLVPILWRMPVARCPSRDNKVALDYLVNGFDFVHYMATGQYDYLGGGPCRIEQAPGPASIMFYAGEVNASTGSNDLDSFDVWEPAHMPFTGPTPNPAPRSITSADQRHQGRTTFVFNDGHAESRTLTPDQVPITLLNPLTTSGL